MIMKKFKCLVAAMLLACSTASFAQSDVEAWKGVRFSYDHTFVNVDIDDYDAEDYNGFSVGYEHAFKVAKKVPLFIQTGGSLNFARCSEDFSDEYEKDEYKTTTLGLTIPVNLVYGVKINETLAIKPYTGFYFRVNLMSKTKNEFGPDGDTETEDWSNFDKDEVGEDGQWNRCQVGWQIGATLDISQFNVGIGYALDFNEISEKTKLGIFAVRLGYNF